MTSGNYGVCDFSTSMKKLNTIAENDIKCLNCPDVFRAGGGRCDFYYPNGTRLLTWHMDYQTELCEFISHSLLTTDQIIGISFGIVGFIGIIVTVAVTLIAWLVDKDEFVRKVKKLGKCIKNSSKTTTREIGTQTEQVEMENTNYSQNSINEEN
jgi:hypothetical protein